MAIFIAFGANLPSAHGAPADTYYAAINALKNYGISILKQSSLWHSAPVDTPDEQPWYTNAVIEINTSLSPHKLLDTLLTIETDFGRVRSFQNAAKEIDLDLIAYHDDVIIGQNDTDLTLPHPRMHERGFVLKPLNEIAPHWTHPVSHKTITNLLIEMPQDQELEKIK